MKHGFLPLHQQNLPLYPQLRFEFWSARDLMMVLESMPEDLPNADSIKKLEHAEKKRLAAPTSKSKKD